MIFALFVETCLSTQPMSESLRSIVIDVANGEKSKEDVVDERSFGHDDRFIKYDMIADTGAFPTH